MRKLMVIFTGALLLGWALPCFADEEVGDEAHLFDDLNADGASDTEVTTEQQGEDEQAPSRETDDADQTPVPDPVEE